ncbi:hypothetical protein [Candidatus Parabeggiatoa sp. HSG14]|uniref:hypothetical protein n=1 Tax=Candidatus Parabeggiatoa sp. HSG14 TaxID=3055593 RepID=UPI0025A7BE38|nr:hypothetical protein [Thiotrichales bacterium HSG14]
MKNQLNQLGKEKKPFLFIIDFDVKNFYIAPFNKLENLLFSIDGISNVISTSSILSKKKIQLIAKNVPNIPTGLFQRKKIVLSKKKSSV